MDATWLEDFLALAEHKTFARAAETRHVTQPAFSRRIQSLEDWMGTRLFVRSPQGTTLTPAGAFLRAHAEDLTRNIYRVRQETLEVAGREASAISIAATHALSFVFFPDWIRSHPQFATLGPLNLISDTMEACEQIMARATPTSCCATTIAMPCPALRPASSRASRLVAMFCCRSVLPQ